MSICAILFALYGFYNRGIQKVRYKQNELYWLLNRLFKQGAVHKLPIHAEVRRFHPLRLKTYACQYDTSVCLNLPYTNLD